ncbi:MAG: DUF4469 domain-containing protein [Spirochaetaceae bacterium]|nr:DUF4469 domain-containing protein [Spirochaetaceae bacterium]
MSENNAFIKLQESANGRVSVKLQKNQFAKEGIENFYGKVERYTYSTQNILDVMTDSVPLVDLGTVASVLNAYANTVLKVLAAGNAVKFGELGTFYIAGKGTVESGNEKPKLTVKFSATKALKDAVQNVEIASSEYVAPSGIIASVVDITTGSTDGTLTLNSSVLLKGSSLKVGGEDSGIWFAPVTDSGEFSGDESTWSKVESALIYNLPSKLLFAIPQSLTNGKYKIVVRTRYAGKSGYERKYLVEAISETVTAA